jgi:PAS domain S-box-containing protein
MILQQLSNQELIDKIGVMVLALDGRGRIEMINSAGCKLLGFSRKELLGKDWVEHFILPEDRENIRDFFAGIISGVEKHQPYHKNHILIRGGERRMISWHNTVLTDSDGKIGGILSTGEDITNEVQAEECIRRSERRYRRFVEHVPDALFIYDVRGRVVDVNEQACAGLGYSREELLSLSVFDIDLDFPRARAEAAIRQTLQADGPLTFQGTHRCKDGHTFPVEAKVNVLEGDDEPLFVSVARNISNRLCQQRRLQDNRDLLRIIIDSIPDIICIKDGRGRWLLANTFDLHLFGLEDVDYRGKADSELARYAPLHKEAFLNCRESDARAWQKKEASRSNEIISVGDGKLGIFDVYKIPIFHSDGRRKALVVIGRDITEQKQVEDKYRKLFEHSPLSYLSFSVSGKILAVNQSVTKIFGYQPEDLIGKNIKEFMSSSSCKFFIDHFHLFLQGASPTGYDYEIYRADGTVVLTQISSTIIRDDAGQPVAVQSVMVDVTRQRHVEERIRESEERYRLLFERAPVGIIHFDTDLHVTACNENYLQLMQTDRDQVIGFDVRNLRDKRILPALEETLAGKEGWWEGEYRTTIRRLTIFISMRTAPLYDGHGNVQGGMAIVVDLSRQKQAETEKIRLMSAIDQAAEAIVITDADALIEYVNPAFERLTGYSAEEAHGKNPHILQSGVHDADFYEEMWQELVSGQVWKGHLINRRKDGTFFEEDVTISPVRSQNGRITNYVSVKRDVTREVALEKQLNQAMKMEAIGTLAGGIAHDFNNILSAILGYAEMVEIQLADDDPARQDVTQIIIAGNRAADLVKQILTFSRQEEEDLRSVKLQFVVKEALKLLRSSLPATIDLQQHIDNNCGFVLADPIRIHQVLMNLCTNAKQAMEGQRGELRVGLTEFDIGSFDPSGSSPSIQSGRWLDLMVSDTGSGIEPDIRERIFDPFFTTKKKAQGTGLGLSVVHGIVKSHGGEITVNSEVGQGTTFHVYLPVIDLEKEEEHPPVKQIPLPRGNEHILLVDDEPLLVDIIKRILVRLGYIVDSYTDSRKALDWFSTHAGDIDLIVTDMTMPHLTGVELAKKILESSPQMPIILCTGYSELIDEEQAKVIGIRKFLPKPVDSKLLAEVVRAVLDNRDAGSEKCEVQ